MKLFSDDTSISAFINL